MTFGLPRIAAATGRPGAEDPALHRALQHRSKTDPLDLQQSGASHYCSLSWFGPLVLLDANPLDRIENATEIRAVVAGGQLLDRGARDKLLADVAVAAAQWT